MTEFVYDKRRITQRVLQEVDPDHTPEQLERAMDTWWRNIRENGGLCLTDAGLQVFVNAGFESYSFDMARRDDKSSWMQSSWIFTVGLDRKMPCPYYLHLNKRERKITVFDSRVASILTLYGSVFEYLKALDIRPNAPSSKFFEG
jgi:hypothetical protein